MRSAVRFPVRLPIAIRAGAAEVMAETQDMSAGGVLFNIDSDMTIGSNIEFTISIPADVIGAPADVLVSGEGRVVRCSPEEGRKSVAAVIDEYRFERA
ncbi:MAG TPA: PilZ domain-containing protein [Terriglobales bacterium]|nr:PilZ domain-containing protein [Terriglobales bacterium]